MLWLISSAFAATPMVENIGWGFTNVWVVRGETGVIVVDTHNEGHEKRIVRRLRRRGIDPTDVKAVVITHGHPDHAGSGAGLRALLGVPVIAGRPDAARLAKGREEEKLPNTSGGANLMSKLIKHHFPGYTPDILVDDRLDLAPYGVSGALVVHGGHTTGSLVVELGGGQALVGDLIRSGFVRKHTPRLHFFHEDVSSAHATLRDVAGSQQTLYPGHGGALKADGVLRWLNEKAPRHEARLAKKAAR